MSRQISLFSFYGNPTKRRKISDSPNNDNVVVRQLLNDLVNDVVKEVKCDEKKVLLMTQCPTKKLLNGERNLCFGILPVERFV